MKPTSVLLPVSCVLVLACCATGGPAQSGVLVLEKEIVLPSEGEAALTLLASAPGASWSLPGAEAATVSVHVDGSYRSDVVLFRGGTSFPYETFLGRLSAGRHRVALYREPSKSSPQAREVRVDDVSARVYPVGDPLYQVAAHAPILYGREDAFSTDTPLWVYHEISRDASTTTIQYTFLFSNEDGGTAADALMARWGRLTDIEWTYRVTLDGSGAVTREEFQDRYHGTSPFRGAKDGSHPVLKDVTRNNLFADGGTSPLRFALVPAEALGDASREEMMDRHPWIYRVMGEEWQRERQASTEIEADPQSRAVSDPRNYLYVDFRVAEPPASASAAKLAVQAKLRGGDLWYSSDHGADDLRIQNRGWRRATIELPPGTTGDRIEALRFTAHPGSPAAPGVSVLTDVRKAFLLDAQYVPGPPLFSWSGRRDLSAADPASSTAAFPLQGQ